MSAPPSISRPEPIDTVALRLALAAPSDSALRSALSHAATMACHPARHDAICFDGFGPAQAQALRDLYDRAYASRASGSVLDALERAISLCPDQPSSPNRAASARASAAS